MDLVEMFDSLKPYTVVKLKVGSSIGNSGEFKDYFVKSKRKVRGGKADRVTLKLAGNPMGCSRYMYKENGKVSFAIGNMAARIEDFEYKGGK